MRALQYSRALIEAMFHCAEWPLVDGEPLECSLHTSNPENDAGELLEKTEIDYPGYRRIDIPRLPTHWKVVAELGRFNAINLQDIAFPPVVREKAGQRKFQYRFMVMRGAKSGMPVRISECEKPIDIDADHPPLIAAGDFKPSINGRLESVQWKRRILEYEFLSKPIPLQADEDFEFALYEHDPQGKDGKLTGKETDYPGYKRITVPRNDKEWKRHDSEVVNARRLAFPGPHEELARGKTWTVRWRAIIGKNSGFPVRVSRLEDAFVFKSGIRLAFPAEEQRIAET